MDKCYYKGKKTKIHPKWKGVNLLFITRTHSFYSLSVGPAPLFIFTFKNNLYFGICNYEFSFLEDYSDWSKTHGDQIDFNQYQPGEQEFNYLLSLDPTFYLLDYNETTKDLDNLSEYEYEILKTNHRELNINKLLS